MCIDGSPCYARLDARVVGCTPEAILECMSLLPKANPNQLLAIVLRRDLARVEREHLSYIGNCVTQIGAGCQTSQTKKRCLQS